jgi:hypothetical protein
MYIVAAAATGAWSGQSGKLAVWLTAVAAWTFITPSNGWSAWVTDEAKRYERKAGEWVAFEGSGSASRSVNRLINGAFQVNQLSLSGTVTLTAGAYGHDGWKAGSSGCTYTFATVENVTTITISAGSLQQTIEGVNLQSGTHTLSWAGTAQGKIGAGSYGSSGITGGSTGGVNLTVEFNAGALSLVQLEPGSSSSSFNHLPYGEYLNLCRRYYQHGPQSIGVTYDATTLVGVIVNFNPPMMAPPTATLISGARVGDAGVAWRLITSIKVLDVSSDGGFCDLYIESSTINKVHTVGTGQLLFSSRI